MQNPEIKIKVYFDFKSPYTYLAMDEIFRMESGSPFAFEWLPWNYPVAQAYGTPESRTVFQENRVRYMYRDVKRIAAPRSMTIKTPQKIYDTTLAGVAALAAKKQGVFRPFVDLVFRKFWAREMDIEDESDISTLFASCGGDVGALSAFLEEGRKEMKAIEEALIAEGVFGIPTLAIGGELFWGSDRLDLAKAKIEELKASKTIPDGAHGRT